MTITLDETWLARPFMKGVVQNMARKLTQKAHGSASAVSADSLHSVTIDGVEVKDLEEIRTASAAEVVPEGTNIVSLTFGPEPPRELKFTITSPLNLSFSITLNSKFQRKTFFDAVVVPYVTYSNRHRSPGEAILDASALVEFRIDGIAPSGHPPTVAHSSTAISVLGYYPAHCELCFSKEAATASAKLEAAHMLRSKVYIAPDNEFRRETQFDWERKQLTAGDGFEFARQIRTCAPLKELKRLYLAHNQLADAGLQSLACALNRKNTPALNRLFLSHNRITDAGIRALAQAWGTSPSGDASRAMPQLDMLRLDSNWIKDEGAAVLLQMAEGGTLTAKEVKLHDNHGISPEARRSLCLIPGAARKCHFDFDPPDTQSPFGGSLGTAPLAPIPGGGFLDLNKT